LKGEDTNTNGESSVILEWRREVASGYFGGRSQAEINRCTRFQTVYFWSSQQQQLWVDIGRKRLAGIAENPGAWLDGAFGRLMTE
jgi:hypothetical protein